MVRPSTMLEASSHTAAPVLWHADRRVVDAVADGGALAPQPLLPDLQHAKRTQAIAHRREQEDTCAAPG
jgi:hypothetical protein